MINCSDCRLILVDYERGELDAVRDAATYAHLQQCSGCRALLEADTEMVDALRAWSAERELPTSVIANVRQAMRTEPAPALMDRWRAILRPVYAAPVAAAVLIVAIFASVHRGPVAPQPSLTGMDFVRDHVAQTASLPSSDRAWSAYVLTSINDSTGSNAAP